MAKILVPIKRVPDYAVKVKINSNADSIVTEGIKWILNPFDEIAVEEAIRIKEKSGNVEEIVVVSIGPKEISEQLRTALAMGADRAILVEANTPIDSDVAHRVFVEIFKKEKFDLIIMGKQAIDSDANQTAQLMAAKLGIPQATFASKIEVNADWSSANVTREVDGGLETLSVKLPAVVSTDLRLNEPRYPSLPGIVKAKKKPMEELAIASLGVSAEPKVVVRKMSLPAQRSAGIKVANVAELINKLKNEAKVI